MLCVGWNVIPLTNIEPCCLPGHGKQQATLGDDPNVFSGVLVLVDDVPAG
jgi:hypothetical protein